MLPSHRDVDDMAAHAIALLSDEKKLEAAKEAAFEQAKRFEKSKIIPVYEALYE
ncbi:MAG: hypothetical protein ABI169_17110 [Chitinophagaceae bacterium]